MDLLALAREQFDDTVALRRHLHRHPEAGPAEQLETMDFIEAQLDRLEIRHVRVPGGGIFAFLEGREAGKTVLLRADMDALPIEESPCNLKGPKVVVSQRPGVMHGCGHDAHTAMLLAEARLLKPLLAERSGSVVLMFEEGEEGHRNGETLLRYITQKHIHIDACYATHVRWDIPAGKVACCSGAAMTGLFRFTLELHGKGGHGSRPDQAVSTIDCFCQIHGALEGVRMRRIRPDTSLTWTFGSVHAGERFNIVPDYLVCQGGIRYLDADSGRAFLGAFREVLEHVCAMNGCTYTLTVNESLLPVVNDPVCRGAFLRSAERYLGREAIFDCEPWMASESYNYLTHMYPSVLSFTGIRNEALGSGAGHHSPEFDLDEEAMLYGTAAAVGYVLDFLDNPPDTSAFRPVSRDLETLLEEVQNV